MSHCIDIQHACKDDIPVSDEILAHWATLPLTEYLTLAELTLRLVDTDEITHLNHTYRKKNKKTNVLAFPMALPEEVALDHVLLGDVIICPAVLREESEHLKTPLTAHWAHIVLHGVLHLLGYDHMVEPDAAVMQALEIKWLAHLGFANPYQTEGHDIE